MKVLPLDNPFIPELPVIEERKEQPEPPLIFEEDEDDSASIIIPNIYNGTLTTNTTVEKVLIEADFAANTIREEAIESF